MSTHARTRVIPVHTSSRAYEVHVGAGILDELGHLVSTVAHPDRVMVVTDDNVAPHYLERALTSLDAFFPGPASHVVPAGEAHKTLETYGQILAAMAEAQLTRSSLVVALGGGVVGDMAGFAAATYMRGIPVVQVPTTLLSMVDSSVGGKTAIDLPVGKNLVGAFLQPLAVLADVRTLATLPEEVFVDGCGEVVKHAVLAAPALFDELCDRPLRQAEDEAYLVRIVARNVRIKRDVVTTDEQERGLRQTLNLGHTLGHAIEAAGAYQTATHGHCVAAGLCCIARASEALGWAEQGLAARIERCTQSQGLPIDTTLSHELIFAQAVHDKKRHGQTVNVVIPECIGTSSLRTISLDELRVLIELGCGDRSAPREGRC